VQEHPISQVMDLSMNSIKDMVDVDTVIGKPVQMVDGTLIIPVSKVNFGFVSGGTDYKETQKEAELKWPFAGGAGAGVSLSPVGFLVVGKDKVQLLPVGTSNPLERVLCSLPDIIERFTGKDVQKESAAQTD